MSGLRRGETRDLEVVVEDESGGRQGVIAAGEEHRGRVVVPTPHERGPHLDALGLQHVGQSVGADGVTAAGSVDVHVAGDPGDR